MHVTIEVSLKVEKLPVNEQDSIKVSDNAREHINLENMEDENERRDKMHGDSERYTKYQPPLQ